MHNKQTPSPFAKIVRAEMLERNIQSVKELTRMGNVSEGDFESVYAMMTAALMRNIPQFPKEGSRVVNLVQSVFGWDNDHLNGVITARRVKC